MQVKVIGADREAAFSTGLRLTKREWIEVYYAFARHRIAERERVVGEFVAWLRECKADWVADAAEAKFGGRVTSQTPVQDS